MLSLLASLQGKRVFVAGDVMLDAHIRGRAKRISPEAPVPVVEVESRSYHPGGAANVAANVAGLEGVCFVSGVIGCDEEGEKLRAELRARGIRTEALLASHERCTTTKTRVMAASQHILRFDQENAEALSRAEEDRFLDAATGALAGAEVCILSDYAKGVLTSRVCRELVEAAARHGIPVIVDPKGADFSKYAGAALITPNLAEARAAAGWREETGDWEIAQLARELAEACTADILITRGEQGMTLLRRPDRVTRLPARARRIFDVTGAGDTVAATLALSLAAGASLEDACRLGNAAAGVVVGIPGTASISAAALRDELETYAPARQQAQDA